MPLDCMIDNPMVRPLELVKTVKTVITCEKRDAIENALLALEGVQDDLLFDEADEVFLLIGKAMLAAEKLLRDMEAM